MEAGGVHAAGGQDRSLAEGHLLLGNVDAHAGGGVGDGQAVGGEQKPLRQALEGLGVGLLVQLAAQSAHRHLWAKRGQYLSL